jgi:hypothetical protein
MYVDYDLIYIYSGTLFNGSKNVDGRAFDKAPAVHARTIGLEPSSIKRRNIMSIPANEVMQIRFRTVEPCGSATDA